MVDVAVALLADVTVLRRDQLADVAVALHLLEVLRRKDVRRREDRLRAQQPDARLREDRFVLSELRRLLLTPKRLAPPAPLLDVWVEDVPRCGDEPHPLVRRARTEHAAVAHDRLQHLDGVPQASCELARFLLSLRARHRG